MSYANIIAGMKTGLEAVSGINYVLDYEPTTVQDAPMMYLLLGGVDREYAAQASLYKYRILATLVIAWQDNDESEATLISLIEAVMTAFDADMTLGGKITSGAALMRSADAGFITIGDVEYRAVTFTAEATELAC